MILTQALNAAASRNPRQIAVRDLGSAVTYGELKERVGRLSNYYAADLEKGARVAVFARNGAYFAQTFFALSNSGNPQLLLDARDSDESIAHELRRLEVKAVLVTADRLARLTDLLRRERLNLKVIEIEKRRAGEYDTSFQPPPDRVLKETDPVLLLATFGAETERRICQFSHSQVYAAGMSVKRLYRFEPNDRMLTTMSWAHPFALTHALLLPLFLGATCVVDPELGTVEEFVDFLAEHKVSRFVGAPKFFFQLLSHCAARKYPLPGVKSITIGLGTISLPLRKTYKLLKIPVLRCFGMPEAVWSLAMDRIDEALDVERARSSPVDGVKMAVVNQDGEEIPGPDRREGRLLVTSDALCHGYLQLEKGVEVRTADHFRGTWLRTDLIARLEGEGNNLRVAALGKSGDMLFLDGAYYSPIPIDEAARKLPGVSEAAGFVRIGKNRESSFAAALVMETKRYNEKELLAQLQEDLPHEHQPQSVHVVNQLPRDAFEALNRQALQRQFSET